MTEKQKKFGLWSIVLLGFNSIIGSGIFLLPASLYKFAGDWSVAIVFITGALVATIALCFAEAAGYFSKNGAAYVYTKEAFGKFAGFEVGFLKWFMQCIAWAVMAVAFKNILSATFGFSGNLPLCYLIVTGTVVSLTVLNLSGVNAAKIVNNLSTIAKMLPLVFLIVTGIWFIHPENIMPGNASQAHYSLGSETLTSALVLAFYSFTGFETFGTAAEDMENPRKNLPRAICISLGIVMMFYALVMAVTVGVLGESVAESNTPLADAAQVVAGDFGYWLITIGSIISIGGINVAASFHIPRALLPLADDQMIPTFFGRKNHNDVPVVAILASCIVTVPIALSGSFAQLAMLSVVARFVQYIPTCLSVLVFRHRFSGNAEAQSSFKAPCGWLMPVVAVGLCLYLLADQPPVKIVVGLSFMALISPFFLMAQKKAKQMKEVNA
ncbi:Serine/threonine exchanger SteT [Vibrio aerogenes CECT 7868]|uniref:Arginine/agmatine antiporter n=1 Tax=Vibrio aerogenes CECT 7868 TaxID=1216006 RepID=A0A1M6DJF2_9VIBR|nr:APC family permease [Vibrio aerogenes]SHI73261.1 Serine/threonine exchanger SteT [Vibrio aerogenes CECT 7868]